MSFKDVYGIEIKIGQMVEFVSPYNHSLVNGEVKYIDTFGYVDIDSAGSHYCILNTHVAVLENQVESKFITGPVYTLPFTPSIKEKPCRVCKKKNDIGVNKCWWCEASHPN